MVKYARGAPYSTQGVWGGNPCRISARALTVGEGHLTVVAYDRGVQPLLPNCLAGRKPDLYLGPPTGQTQQEDRGQGNSFDVIHKGQPIGQD